jgi:hypothetical protein
MRDGALFLLSYVRITVTEQEPAEPQQMERVRPGTVLLGVLEHIAVHCQQVNRCVRRVHGFADLEFAEACALATCAASFELRPTQLTSAHNETSPDS